MEETEIKKENRKTKSASFDLMLIKSLACTLIIIGILVIKNNNANVFQNVCIWYKTTVREQNLDLIEAKDSIYNFGSNAVNKIAAVISSF